VEGVRVMVLNASFNNISVIPWLMCFVAADKKYNFQYKKYK
jgi:hypothetical protein